MRPVPARRGGRAPALKKIPATEARGTDTKKISISAVNSSRGCIYGKANLCRPDVTPSLGCSGHYAMLADSRVGRLHHILDL